MVQKECSEILHQCTACKKWVPESYYSKTKKTCQECVALSMAGFPPKSETHTAADNELQKVISAIKAFDTFFGRRR